MCSKFSKSVAFNNKKAVDVAILDYVKNKNFTNLVKQLIVESMKNEGIEIPSKKAKVTATDQKPQKELSPLEQLKLKLSEKNIHNRSNDSANP